MIEYKFREDEILEELKQYIDGTYAGHYGSNNKNLQSLEVIIARGRGMDFCLGNVDKYNDRYGKKGTVEDYRKDLLKVIHYGILALSEHDRRYGYETNTQETES
jgi:hypothetical protein